MSFGGTGSGSSQFRLKFSRPMIILMATFLGLVVIIVALLLLWPSLARRPAGGEQRAVAVATAAPTSTVPVVTEIPSPAAVGEVTSAPAPTSAPPPSTTPKPVAPAPEVVATPVPAPTRGAAPAAPAAPAATTMPVGAGESALPASSTGLPWLIPVGVLLLIAVAWWRWRRARSTG